MAVTATTKRYKYGGNPNALDGGCLEHLLVQSIFDVVQPQKKTAIRSNQRKQTHQMQTKTEFIQGFVWRKAFTHSKRGRYASIPGSLRAWQQTQPLLQQEPLAWQHAEKGCAL